MLEDMSKFYKVEYHNDEQAATDISSKLGIPPRAGETINLVDHVIFAVSESINAFVPTGTQDEQVDKLMLFLMGDVDSLSSFMKPEIPIVLPDEVIEPEIVIEAEPDYKTLYLDIAPKYTALIAALDVGAPIPGDTCPHCNQHIPLPWPR